MSNEKQNPKLDLQGNYAEKVLSYYLWGQASVGWVTCCLCIIKTYLN